jgi:hypothetical protein
VNGQDNLLTGRRSSTRQPTFRERNGQQFFPGFMPAPLTNDSITSREAAAKADAKQPSRLRAILDLVKRRRSYGCTRQEIADSLGLLIQSVCSPVRQLLDSGLVIETEEQRPTRNGAKAAVLKSPEHVPQALAAKPARVCPAITA